MSELIVDGTLYVTEREYDRMSCNGCAAFGNKSLKVLCDTSVCAGGVVWTVAACLSATDNTESQLPKLLERAIAAVQELLAITDHDKEANEALAAELTAELEKIK